MHTDLAGTSNSAGAPHSCHPKVNAPKQHEPDEDANRLSTVRGDLEPLSRLPAPNPSPCDPAGTPYGGDSFELRRLEGWTPEFSRLQRAAPARNATSCWSSRPGPASPSASPLSPLTRPTDSDPVLPTSPGASSPCGPLASLLDLLLDDPDDVCDTDVDRLPRLSSRSWRSRSLLPNSSIPFDCVIHAASPGSSPRSFAWLFPRSFTWLFT